MTAETTVNFLPSWKHATDPSDAPILRTCDEDGTHHFSHVKKLALSGAHYLHAVNAVNDTTRPMRISTAVHQIILGPRADKSVVVYDGEARRGKEWLAFEAEHGQHEILTAPEWAEAAEAANEIKNDPLVRARLEGARTEVPLSWEDGGIRCSTSGVDILGNGALGDLKGTHNAQPDAWQRAAFRMSYHVQLVWYRRGAHANGYELPNGLFVLGYEMTPPYAVVDLELTEEMIDLGERQLSMWLEGLRALRGAIPTPRRSKDWPAYAQSPVPWALPAWARDDEEESDE